MGDVIVVKPYEGKVLNEKGDVITDCSLKNDMLFDEAQAGGRIPLIIGRSLTERARELLGKGPSDAFRRPDSGDASDKGFTLAQKVVGRACGVEGVRPDTYCEPRMATVGSQDTTGPMTRDELKELACLGFSADLVLQTFCHTAAYPKPVDIETQHTLPDFMTTRGGVSLRPGDGIIHSWINRMLLPDQVGTGGDSHTRFPLGISFPGGSGLVAFAAALGVMPLDMPESVLVRFTGKMQPGITLAGPRQRHSLHGHPEGIADGGEEGQEERFQWPHPRNRGTARSDRGAGLRAIRRQRRALGGRLHHRPQRGIGGRISALQRCHAALDDRQRLSRRPHPRAPRPCHGGVARESDVAARGQERGVREVIEINMDEITEPLLACPNDPDDVKPLSEVAGTTIDEVFIGSCMTNIGHFRAAGKLLQAAGGVIPTRLWVAPPTKMDEHQLKEEGYYNIYATAGARTEMPGCSLCMGNQARIAANSTAVSTSTRNFPNRLGQGANVFLSSAELAAVAAITRQAADGRGVHGATPRRSTRWHRRSIGT